MNLNLFEWLCRVWKSILNTSINVLNQITGSTLARENLQKIQWVRIIGNVGWVGLRDVGLNHHSEVSRPVSTKDRYGLSLWSLCLWVCQGDYLLLCHHRWQRKRRRSPLSPGLHKWSIMLFGVCRNWLSETNGWAAERVRTATLRSLSQPASKGVHAADLKPCQGRVIPGLDDHSVCDGTTRSWVESTS